MEKKHTIAAVGAGGTTKIFDKNKNLLTRVFDVKSVEDYIKRFDEMIDRKKGLF